MHLISLTQYNRSSQTVPANPTLQLLLTKYYVEIIVQSKISLDRCKHYSSHLFLIWLIFLACIFICLYSESNFSRLSLTHKSNNTHDGFCMSLSRVIIYYNIALHLTSFIFIISEGENLLRDLEMLRDRAEYFARQSRQINSLNGVGFGQSKRFDTLR